MPYTPYLTDTDRAIDRDANEMLSPQANASGAGYIAQGYANMDVLPEQMALADMLERRQTLSMRSRQGRREQRDEDVAAAEQDEFDGYSASVRGLKGLPENERSARMRDMLVENPNLANNPLVNKANASIYLNDRAALDAKENVLKTKQFENDMRAENYEEGAFEEKVQLQDMQRKNALEGARLLNKQQEELNYQIENGDLSKVGESVFNLQVFGDSEEGRAKRDGLIKTIAYLPKETKEDRDGIRAISDIAGSLAMGGKVKELKSYANINNRGLIRSVLKDTGIDLTNLPADRPSRDAHIKAAGERFLANNGDMQSFNAYVKKVKDYNDSEESLNLLTDEFTKSITAIETLAQNPDPESKRKLTGEIALLNAKAAGWKGHTQRQFEVEDREQKLREDADKRAKLDSDMREKSRSTNLRERQIGNSHLVAKTRLRLQERGQEIGLLDELQEIELNGDEEAYGITPKMDKKQRIQKLKDMFPSQPGAADNDL
jgi:hypothetical protein